jgi:hypothetical protein
MSALTRHWLTWAVTTALLALYIGATEIESYTADVPLVLKPGNVVDVDVFRFYENELRLSLLFRTEGCERRPELGNATGAPPHDGTLKLRPGATVKIEASVDGETPVPFEAMPGSSQCGNLRLLTTNLSTAPGVYPWPPPANLPKPILGLGFNHLQVKVTGVDSPLVGETVRLYVVAALGLKTTTPNVAWLWQGFLAELAAPVTQTIWLLVLLFLTWRTIMRRRRGEADELVD